MTLDEAIKHAEEVAEDKERNAGYFYDKESASYKKKCCKCAEEHRQLAEWLKELKQLREQESKTGHWISLDDFRGKYNENGFMCSECGEHSDFEENFCPNCGTKMKESKEEEE